MATGKHDIDLESMGLDKHLAKLAQKALLEKKIGKIQEDVASKILEIEKNKLLIEEALLSKNKGYISFVKTGLKVNKLLTEEIRQLGKEYQQLNNLLPEEVKQSEKLKDIWAEFSNTVLGKVLIKLKDIFSEFDNAAAKFRQEFGITRKVTSQIDYDARHIATSFRDIGVTAEIAYKSSASIGKVFGTLQNVSYDLVKNISIISAQLGISEDESANFLLSMATLNKTTGDVNTHLLSFTAALSEASGTSLPEIMTDINNATKSSYSFMSRDALATIKAAVAAKQLNTSLSEVAKSAHSLVNFSQSITEEMEASVLLGESLNLQHARELSYRRDTKGLNEEILKLAKQTNFEQLDVFQQEAVAKAFGKQADEVARILEADRRRSKIRLNPALAEQLRTVEKLQSANESIAKSEAERYSQELKSEANQARLVALSNTWTQILQKLAVGWLPAIDWALRVITKPLIWIGNLFEIINNNTAEWVSGALVGIGAVVLSFKALGAIIGKVGRSLGKGLGEGLGALGKAGSTPHLWAAVGVLAALSGIFVVFAYGATLVAKALKEVKDVDLVNIAKGMAALGASMYIWAPLSVFLPAISSGIMILSGAFWVLGKSTVTLGENIVNISNGLSSIKGLDFSSTISQVYSLSNAVMELSGVIDGIPDIKFNKLKELSVTSGNTENNKSSPLLEEMSAIKDELKALRNDFAKGGIAANFNLDSQLLSSAVDRMTQFRKGYGTNVVMS